MAALTLPGWDMCRGYRSEALIGKPVSLPLMVELLPALAGNQRRSLRRLHGIAAECVGRGFQQVDLSAVALTHLGLVLAGGGQAVGAAALPATLESLACCGEYHAGFLAGLADVWSLPCLARIHVRCRDIVVPPTMAPCWRGKHIVLTAEQRVVINCDTGLEEAEGLFSAAITVRIEAGIIVFTGLHGAPQLRPLAGMLCPDTLGEAVMDIYQREGVGFFTAQYPDAPAVGWAAVLHALIRERGSLFAFEVDNRFCRVRFAWRRWLLRGTRAHEAAARLHFQAAEWASSEV